MTTTRRQRTVEAEAAEKIVLEALREQDEQRNSRLKQLELEIKQLTEENEKAQSGHPITERDGLPSFTQFARGAPAIDELGVDLLLGVEQKAAAALALERERLKAEAASSAALRQCRIEIAALAAEKCVRRPCCRCACPAVRAAADRVLGSKRLADNAQLNSRSFRLYATMQQEQRDERSRCLCRGDLKKIWSNTGSAIFGASQRYFELVAFDTETSLRWFKDSRDTSPMALKGEVDLLDINSVTHPVGNNLLTFEVVLKEGSVVRRNLRTTPTEAAARPSIVLIADTERTAWHWVACLRGGAFATAEIKRLTAELAREKLRNDPAYRQLEADGDDF